MIGRKVQKGPSTFTRHIHVHTSILKNRNSLDGIKTRMLVVIWSTVKSPQGPTTRLLSCYSFINRATSLLPSSPTSQLQATTNISPFKTFLLFQEGYK